LRRLLPICVVMLLVFFSRFALGSEFTIKIHHPLPLSSTIHQKVILPWCERIEIETSKRLQCEIYPSMQLGGNVPQLIDQVRDGVVDVIWTLPGFSPGRFPKTEVFELPFMIRDAEATSEALWDYVNQYSLDEYEGMQLLAMHVHGGGVLHSTKRVIQTEKDLVRMKVRAPTRQTTQLLSLLGATPVGMPVPQVPEALSKGVIEATLLPYEVMPALRVDELTRHHSEPGSDQPKIYTSTFLFAMNHAFFESLPEDLRGIVQSNSGPNLSRLMGRVFKEAEMVNRETLDPETIHVLSDEVIDRWKLKSQSLHDRWISERGDVGKHLYQEARRLIMKYETPD
jgi:TRAP-type C4-dicarboxylate transport system substrate-binding protein